MIKPKNLCFTLLLPSARHYSHIHFKEQSKAAYFLMASKDFLQELKLVYKMFLV